MRRTMMHSKIHRARVTDADLHYEGSVTIDERLMEAADIIAYQSIHIWNVTRGTRLQTYALPGPAGSGVICANGAAAHHNEPGDIVILCTYCELRDEEAREHAGISVLVDEENGIREVKEELSGASLPEKRAVS